jgi:hypothetical protein
MATFPVAIAGEIALRVLAPVANPYEEIERLKPQINQYLRFEYPRNYSANTEAEPGLPGVTGTHRAGSRGNHFKIVFMTQQTTWNSTVDPSARTHHWMRYRAGAPIAEGANPGVGFTFREGAMDAAMERLNDTMRSVAAKESVPVYDLAQMLPKSLEFFYDDCHFNVAGASAAGKGLAAFLMAQRLTPAVTH